MAFIRQKHSTDCGVAALAMLCDVSYEEAYRAIPWRREGILNGTNTDQIVEGARKFKFTTKTRQLRIAGERLNYEVRGTRSGRLKPVQAPVGWVEKHGTKVDYRIWSFIPDNSLVKVPGRYGRNWHWVVWRKGRVYDPCRGVFKPEKYYDKLGFNGFPSSYLQFIKENIG